MVNNIFSMVKNLQIKKNMRKTSALQFVKLQTEKCIFIELKSTFKIVFKGISPPYTCMQL